MFKFLIVTAIALSATAPALARSQTDRKPQDPNRIVCRTNEVLGSRLQTQKTCMTASEWDRLEHSQRETVERVQSLRTTNSQ
ncbi:hypothetical protein KX816_12555 [Sphingosinicellaceae bacterium]|nr:hypothetical protein KX816_12555 [Sphingosinicellaceae bacterium]